MNTEDLDFKKICINNGVIAGVILVALTYISYTLGHAEQGNNTLVAIYYIIFPAIVIYTIINYKKTNDGFISLSQGIKIGLIIGVVSALIYSVYNIIFNQFIDPEFIDKVLAVAEEKMYESNPDITDEQVEMGMSMARKFSSPLLGSAMFIMMSAFFGFIYGIITGAIIKNERSV